MYAVDENDDFNLKVISSIFAFLFHPFPNLSLHSPDTHAQRSNFDRMKLSIMLPLSRAPISALLLTVDIMLGHRAMRGFRSSEGSVEKSKPSQAIERAIGIYVFIAGWLRWEGGRVVMARDSRFILHPGQNLVVFSYRKMRGFESHPSLVIPKQQSSISILTVFSQPLTFHFLLFYYVPLGVGMVVGRLLIRRGRLRG